MECVGGSYNPPQTLQVEQFISHQIEAALRTGIPRSGSIPLVNSEGGTIKLPRSGSDHVINHQGTGGPRSLFAVGLTNFIGKEWKMSLFAENEEGGLMSACIGSTVDMHTM